jgi:hypothetical protein
MQEGPGRVLAAMAESAVPMRPGCLALWMQERAKREALEIYQGDICWSILKSIHVIHKSDADIMSCSDMADKLWPWRKPQRRQITNQQVIGRVEDMLDTFL